MSAVLSVATSRPLVGPENDQRGFLSSCDFEIFVREYNARLMAVARRLLTSEEDAADAVQDGLLSAFVARNSYRGDSTVYTWLYRIVVNACLMKMRSRRRTAVASLDALSPTCDDDDRLLRTKSNATSAANHLEREETCAAVRAAIDRLPSDYRAVLLLRDIKELDTNEVAAILNLSHIVLKTRLHRARQALRKVLRPGWRT
jgi:RNA polymerase sigma-70 factor (ECF subfamily)